MKRVGFIIIGMLGLSLAVGFWLWRPYYFLLDRASLERAASAGNRTLVELYLALGAETNATPANLVEAVRQGETEKVRKMLAAEPSLARAGVEDLPPPFWVSALWSAAFHGNLAIVKMLVEHGTEVNESAIDVAASYGHIEVVKFLLDHAGEATRKDLGQSLLASAVDSGSKETLALLLAAGVPAKKIDNEGNRENSPLFSAIWRQDPGMIRMLLAAGAEPTVFEEAGLGRIEAVGRRLDQDPGLIRSCDENGMTMLAVAAKTCNLELARYMLDRGAEVDRTAVDCGFPTGGYCATPFLMAVGNLEMMKLLLSRGADIYAERYEDGNASCLTHDFTILKFLLESGMKVENHKDPDEMAAGNCMSLLHAGKDLRFAELLRKYGADVNARGVSGTTPLHWACTPEIAEWLIQEGAEVNAEDEGRRTPLWNIASLLYEDEGCDNVGVMKVLLAHGAKLLDHEGRSPLIATFQPQVVKLLVAHGAHINERDERGWTPLHEAVARDNCGQWGCRKLVGAILQSGADLNARDPEGHTPLWHAMLWRWKRSEMVDLLRSYGATE